MGFQFHVIDSYKEDTEKINDSDSIESEQEYQIEETELKFYLFGRTGKIFNNGNRTEKNTKLGESVCMQITGFKPYFYVGIPASYYLPKSVSSVTGLNFKDSKNPLIKQINGNMERVRFALHNYLNTRLKNYQYGLADVTIVYKTDIIGFRDSQKLPFIKLSFLNDQVKFKTKYFFNYEITLYGICKEQKFQLYNANVDSYLQFIHQTNIPSTGWVEIDYKFLEFSCESKHEQEALNQLNKHTNKLKEINFINFSEKEKDSFCTIEAHVKSDFIKPCTDISIINEIPDYIEMSFDIEAYSGDEKSFPDPKRDADACIQIGSTLKRYGDKEPYLKHIITLKGCNPIEGVVVESYRTESEVLLAWKRMLRDHKVDIIYSYNGMNFDMWYMYMRSMKVNCEHDFSHLSKLKHVQSTLPKDSVFESKAYNAVNFRIVNTVGRAQIDLLPYIRREHKLDSYKLDDVAEHFLGEHKIPMDYQELFKMQRMGDAERTKIAEYCVQDCNLPQRLSDKLSILPNMIGMANVTMVPMNYLLVRGQQIKVYSQLINECEKSNFVCPTIQKKYEPKESTNSTNSTNSTEVTKKSVTVGTSGVDGSDDEKFEGATVLDACAGAYGIHLENTKYLQQFPDLIKFYKESQEQGVKLVLPKSYLDKLTKAMKEQIEMLVTILNNAEPISGLDFKSLYPSIMIANNLCYLTWIINSEDLKRTDIKYRTFDVNGKPVHFVYKVLNKVTNEWDDYEGVLPRILKNLLKARSDTRKKIKQITDIFQKSVLEGLQLAYKVSCNSVYGFTGTGRIIRTFYKNKNGEDQTNYLYDTGDSTGMLPCMEIASSVTFKGRQMIDESKAYAESNYDCKVIYGDTDSIYVKFSVNGRQGNEALRYVFPIAEKCSAEITKLFETPNELEFEKVYYPLILFSKKRYAGIQWTNPETSDGVDMKGVSMKRRDFCKYAKESGIKLLDILLKQQDIDLAMSYTRKVALDLLTDTVNMDQLIISKTLQKSYKSAQAHAALAEKMELRAPGSGAKPGDRVPYILVDVKKEYYKTHKKSDKIKQTDMAEDPSYAIKNKLKIDTMYYFEHQVEKTIIFLMKYFHADPKSIYVDIVRDKNNKDSGMKNISNWFK